MPLVKTEGQKIESPDETNASLSASAATPNKQPSFPQGSYSQQNPYNQIPQNNYDMPPFGNDANNPFTMQLPLNAQMFLAATMPNDPFSSLMMAGSNNLPTPTYNFTPNTILPGGNGSGMTELGKGSLQQPYPPTTLGLDSTLGTGVAPSDLDLNRGFLGGGGEYGHSQSLFEQAIGGYSEEDATPPAGTPGLGGELWSSFIETDQWDAAPSASQ